MFKIALFVTILIAFSAYFLNNPIKEYFKGKSLGVNDPQGTIRIFKSIKRFDGKGSKKLYLSILGDVYDVSTAPNYYGPGSTYHVFVGKDASRSFVTGDFSVSESSGALDDLKGFTNEDYSALKHWVDFYAKNYKFVGRLEGLYYNEDGSETEYKKEVNKLIEAVEREKEEESKKKEDFPPCNSEWNSDTDITTVWCTKESGGAHRDWIGVPRKYYQPGSRTFRCACVNEDKLNLKNLKEYEGCDSSSSTCKVKNIIM